MVIVKLMGGLGNQMFQYAAARRLAWRHNAELKLDLSFLENAPRGVAHRTFELHNLNISAGIARRDEVAEMTGRGRNWFETIWVRLRRISGKSKFRRSVFKERHFQFGPELLNAPDDIYMDGYWQCEKYFKDIREIICREFVVKYPLSGKNLELSETIKNANSISVHIRRGDYVTDPATNRFHGICGPEYYTKGIEAMRGKVENPHFYVFSDDPEWVKENMISLSSVTYVNNNTPDKGYEDLRLMSFCRHHIIANSSFSWWGAWLCDNPVKIVIAPQKWFNAAANNTDDLLPESWIRI